METKGQEYHLYPFTDRTIPSCSVVKHHLLVQSKAIVQGWEINIVENKAMFPPVSFALHCTLAS